MSESGAINTSILTHTLKSFCNEMISGRAVNKVDGSKLQFQMEETRSIFKWYVDNQGKWASNVQKLDIESIVNQIIIKPPSLPELNNSNDTKAKNIFHLKSVRAHRFAGIHSYKSPNVMPEEFYFEFKAPITVIEGFNGSGKTSLINAVSWCLTGNIHRSQRAPEKMIEPIQIHLSEDGATAEYIIAAITPIPDASVLKGLSDKDLIVDTFVELIFEDQDKKSYKLRRSIEKNNRGKLVIKEPDFSPLNLDPISYEIGTLMPGLIPYVSFERNSNIGEAVAFLTGIQPLQDLAKHASKVQAKLKKEIPDEKRKEIEDVSSDYEKIKVELIKLLGDHKDIVVGQISAFTEDNLQESLKIRKGEFEKLQESALTEVKNTLGSDFDVANPESRADLISNIGPAIGYLDFSQLKNLPSALKAENLKKIDGNKIDEIKLKITKLAIEIEEILTLENNPDSAKRIRLYSKIANWLVDEKALDGLNLCPVCASDINNKKDNITKQIIVDHIKDLANSDKSYLSMGIAAWEKMAITQLNEILPVELKSFIAGDIPEKPILLYKDSFEKDLFLTTPFKKSLSVLSKKMESINQEVLKGIPDLKFDPIPINNSLFEKVPNFFSHALKIYKGIESTIWLKDNDFLVESFFVGVIGPNSENKKSASDASLKTLSALLNNLNNIVSHATPISEAIHKIDRMNDLVSKKLKIEDRISQYKKAEIAIDPIVSLDKIVSEIVSGLLEKLSSSTKQWKDRLYKAAFVGAPILDRAGIKGQGILEIEAKIKGTSVLAQHVSNASDLRASLLAFLLAFWDYMFKQRGGLSLILFDDVHELFDEANRRKVADSIPQIINELGAEIIITTNDTRFRRSLTSSSEHLLNKKNVDIRCVHPLTVIRDHIELGLFSEEIEKKFKDFEEPSNLNNHQVARDYMKDLRIYIEQRVIDFFDIPSSGVTSKSTLSDLIGAISRCRNQGLEPFNGAVFKSLLDDASLKSGSVFLKTLNNAHHGEEQNITFAEVASLKADCIRAKTLVDNCCEDYHRWLRRDSRSNVIELPALPAVIAKPSFAAPVIDDIAAATSYSGEATHSHEIFGVEWFENKSIYYLNTHNLGFSAPFGSHVIVSTSDEVVQNNRMVVALSENKIFARRLLKTDSDPALIALGSESENPRKRSKSLFLKIEQVRLMKIMGVLFESDNFFHKSSEEAVLNLNSKILNNVEIVFKIKGESALPLALPGQKILGGKIISSSEFSSHEGVLVAISTSNGDYFKRIGKALPGFPHIRHLESIGGLGESLIVRLEDLDDGLKKLPLLHSARKVMGVLYDVS